jgi:hypothetical protein
MYLFKRSRGEELQPLIIPSQNSSALDAGSNKVTGRYDGIYEDKSNPYTKLNPKDERKLRTKAREAYQSLKKSCSIL